MNHANKAVIHKIPTKDHLRGTMSCLAFTPTVATKWSLNSSKEIFPLELMKTHTSIQTYSLVDFVCYPTQTEAPEPEAELLLHQVPGSPPPKCQRRSSGESEVINTHNWKCQSVTCCHDSRQSLPRTRPFQAKAKLFAAANWVCVFGMTAYRSVASKEAEKFSLTLY